MSIWTFEQVSYVELCEQYGYMYTIWTMWSCEQCANNNVTDNINTEDNWTMRVYEQCDYDMNTWLSKQVYKMQPNLSIPTIWQTMW